MRRLRPGLPLRLFTPPEPERDAPLRRPTAPDAPPDEAHAWAGFRLFLRCVDRRFWSWQPEFEALGNLRERRKREVFYQINRSTVENQIRANEQALEKTFLGSKVLEGEMAPWIR